MAEGTTTRAELPRAALKDTLLVLGEVLLPLVARGVIARRPRAVALAERMDADRRAVRRAGVPAPAAQLATAPSATPDSL